MPSLRPRTSRPSYASLIGLGTNEDKPGRIPVDDESSGSEFAPETKKSRKESGAIRDDESDEEDDELISDDENVSSQHVPSHNLQSSTPTASTSQQRPKVKTKGRGISVVKSTVSKPTTLSGSFRRQMYVLPTPSVHHRHRAVPLYSVPGRVERLASLPTSIFLTPEVVLTNNFTMNAKTVDRLNKAWGYNVGSGPIWELSEDRGWFKEARSPMQFERDRRPKVHTNIPVLNGWKILTEEEAALYLPTDDVITEEGHFRPPPPIPCSFGLFESQISRPTRMFQTIKMADLIPNNPAHVLNAGAPVWGIDWCPLHPDTRQACGNTYYLAVAPLPSPSYSPAIGIRVQRPSRACIQIWSLSSNASVPTTSTADNGKERASEFDYGKMGCDMVLCIDSGPALELKWCPLPSPSVEGQFPRKLGLLSGTFEDGSFAIYAVPNPGDVAPSEHDSSQPVYVLLPEPILRIELEDTCCWSIDWANSETVAIGLTNGSMAVYDIGSTLKQVQDSSFAPFTNLLPTYYLNIHQAAVRALAWIRAPTNYNSGEPRFDEDPMIICSGGYDGLAESCITHIRETDVINSMSYSPYGGGPVTVDHDDAVKAYSASPKMLGRGHMLVEPHGPVWSISASDYHPQLVVGAADGSCTTTNLLRSTRRGGSVPFFAHKVFQMDYSRATKEFRMLEQFFPQETQDRGAANNPKNFKLKNTANDERGTGVWPRQVGVQRVVWNSGSGLGGAGLLASATGSGLCRVDVLSGRFIKEKMAKMPYGGVEGIRLENGDDMEVDSDEGSD
ncbi:hypothetical protein D9757_003666 [Collybiopsis confluens]|uniref:Uncharacterized protein n=1 Tax=Collybiopsis confluens TaxID=2823264 RepID=A0A8H5HUJ4_9AGAR|nr:hypothetical protein D9757_003666 [Collybiopsis confluens]